MPSTLNASIQKVHLSYSYIITLKQPQAGGVGVAHFFFFPSSCHTRDARFFNSKSEFQMGVSQNRGYPKMDGENNGSKPYEQMDDLGGFPLFLVQHPFQAQGLLFTIRLLSFSLDRLDFPR